MKADEGLRKALVARAEGWQERVPVFRLAEPRIPDLERSAIDLARRFAADRGFRETRFSVAREDRRTVIHLSERGRVVLHHPSGALAAESGREPWEAMISRDVEADGVDRAELRRHAEEAIRRLGLDRSEGKESLSFERLWRIKGSGATREGEHGRVCLARAVGAFRRQLHGLPVWGAASVFVKLAAEGRIDGFGLEWRETVGDALDQAEVRDPEEGADAVLRELQAGLPGGRLTLEDYEPTLFALGYFSLPKRRPQTVMQPVWVALLRARGWTTLSRAIVVPAAHTAYEPICREVTLPPRDALKPAPRGPRSKGPAKGPRKSAT